MNRVQITKGILPEQLLREAGDVAASAVMMRTNLTSWPPEVVGMSTAILLHDIKGSLADRISEAVRPFVPEHLYQYVWDITYTFGGRLSYLPFHSDGRNKYSMTIYANDTWSPDWAGFFVYEDTDGEFRAILPEFNKAVHFTPPIDHCTVMPNINAPVRKSIQIFVQENLKETK